MGRGSSGLGKKSGGKSGGTPSGVTFAQFSAMSDTQKFQTMSDILNNQSIVVPDYLDDSPTTKVIYALGMNTKPTVVSDSALDNMPGEEIFRTVTDVPSPPPYAKDILDQIRTGDYTQMSGSGGSAHGRAIYFAADFGESRDYGWGKTDATMARAKINPKANIIGEQALENKMKRDPNWKRLPGVGNTDAKALYAISHGIDGWKAKRGWGSSYRMIVNRGALTMSSTSKDVSGRGRGQTWSNAPTR